MPSGSSSRGGDGTAFLQTVVAYTQRVLTGVAGESLPPVEILAELRAGARVAERCRLARLDGRRELAGELGDVVCGVQTLDSVLGRTLAQRGEFEPASAVLEPQIARRAMQAWSVRFNEW